MAASKCQQFGVVEQVTRESQHLDVDKVVGYLMDAKLADSRPLINVCDRFDRCCPATQSCVPLLSMSVQLIFPLAIIC